MVMQLQQRAEFETYTDSTTHSFKYLSNEWQKECFQISVVYWSKLLKNQRLTSSWIGDRVLESVTYNPLKSHKQTHT